MNIAIANDHTAVEMKRHIVAYLEAKGYTLLNLGTNTEERVDYPIFGKRVADAIVAGEADLGILICGTGIGISLAANKVKGIRAAVCSEPYSAMMTRRHNNSNVIAFGARVVGPATAEMIVDAFLEAEYEGGRHEARVEMLSQIENGEL